MTEIRIKKPPIWFWIVSVVALIWNAMGVMAYLAQAYMTDEMIAKLPEKQQAEFLIEYPSWVIAVFAIAVFAGALGCLTLLLRKKWAYNLFILSAISAIAQHIYLFMNVEMQSVIMPIMIIIVCILLIGFAKKSISNEWIS